MDRPNALLLGAIALLGTIIFIKRRTISNTLRNTMNGSYFTVSELCQSTTARANNIDNTPTAAHRANLQALITNLLNPIRERYGKPITVTSGYRCEALNRKVGGVKNSQHLTGQAADLQGSNGNDISQLKEIFKAALAVGRYDQLILEHVGNSRWVHVSYDPKRNRRQLLAYSGGKYTTITPQNWQNYV